MNVLLAYNHYAVSSGRYMTDAFQRIGHDTWHIGPPKGRDIWSMRVPEHYVHAPDRVDGSDDPYRLPERPFDLAVVMDTASAMLDLPDKLGLKALRAPIVVYGVDNHVCSYRRPWFDHYFLAHHDGPVQPVRLDDESWLPCAYDPAWYMPSATPFGEREYDVAMIGFMYPLRRELVRLLEAEGWRVLAGTGLLFDQYADAYQNARISLCISAAGDVAQRVFETAAMGCHVLSDPCADFERLEARGIAVCPPEQMIARVNELLSSNDAERAIAESLEWATPHTWDERARHIAAWAEKR